MDSVIELFKSSSVPHDILVLALVSVCGLLIGKLEIKGLGLGIAGVLFAGLFFGHYGLVASHETIDLVRELGLILFVYAVGVQVGPGFVSSLRQQGLALNLMAAAIIFLGAVVTYGVSRWGGVPMAVAAGLFSGGTTNTPSLAAAQGALQQIPNGEQMASMPGVGYALAYPFGVMGIILTMLLSRALFRVNVEKEVAEEAGPEKPPLHSVHLEVTNANLDNVAIRDLPFIKGSGIVVSRVKSGDSIALGRGDTLLHVGDVILAIGEKSALEEFQRIVGHVVEADLRAAAADLLIRRMIVTHRKALGKTINELGWSGRYGVVVTRITRAGLELAPHSDLKLNFGDILLCVGAEEGIARVAEEVGNSAKELEHPALLPVFIGIALGVLLGSWSIPILGVPYPIKLGLAGGPLLVAIALSSIGRVGPLVWYLPPSANAALREFGIILFLGATGIKAGGVFVEAFSSGNGWHWIAMGALITLIPLIVVSLVARVFLKLKFASLCGLLAGSTTDPPALAFAGNITNSEAPLLAYAAVYPLVMILRIVAAQLLIIFFAR